MNGITRRDFLEGSLLTAAGMAVAAQSAPAASVDPLTPAGPIVDTHVYLFQWPFRRIPNDTTSELVRHLRSRGVVQAWAGSFEGVFHRDVGGVNTRLAEECQRVSDGFLVPFGTVNPKLPDWEEDLRRCHEDLRMPGIRLHPNYHGYALDDPDFARLLDLASRRGMIVQLAAWMEDERHQSPLMPVPTVNLAPLGKLIDGLPDLRIVVLNGYRVPRTASLASLVNSKHAYFDIALLETLAALARMLEEVSVDRILFGSYSPMFYFESTLLKLPESAVYGAPARQILEKNARRLLAGVRKESVR